MKHTIVDHQVARTSFRHYPLGSSLILAKKVQGQRLGPLVDLRDDFVDVGKGDDGQQRPKNLFFQKIMSEAKHIGGRDLAANGDDEWQNFGFDITEYSIKYSGCSTVKSYSDELAATYASTVLAANRFVIFRLCPSFYCNKYSK